MHDSSSEWGWRGEEEKKLIFTLLPFVGQTFAMMLSHLAIPVALLMAIALAKGEATIKATSMITPDCKRVFSYKVYGKVEMVQKASGGETTITVKLWGFQPNTVHGFHIHDKGDIHSRGCLSTGGHYNPFGVNHGAKDDIIRHVGDLGNVKADSNGEVRLTFEDKMVSLVGKYSVAGRAFVVHAMQDDLGRGEGSQRAGSLKTGNAGARVACGIIYYS
eukprot:gene2293-17908_t